ADEAEVAHQEQHTKRDQEKRPEDPTACRHGRTRCTSSRTPRAMTTSGQTICDWTPRKIPALLKKKITPTRMSRYPKAMRRRSVWRSSTACAMLSGLAGDP